MVMTELVDAPVEDSTTTSAHFGGTVVVSAAASWFHGTELLDKYSNSFEFKVVLDGLRN